MQSSLHIPVGEVHRVGNVTAAHLQRIGIQTVLDLIFYFPFRHEDLSQTTTIEDMPMGQTVTLNVTVEKIRNWRSRGKRKLMTEAIVADETGTLKVLWFNQPWMSKTLTTGTNVYLSGKIDPDKKPVVLFNPIYEKVSDNAPTHTARIVPMYPLTSGVTQKQLRFLIKLALERFLVEVQDPLSQDIQDHYDLMPLQQALQEVHFPQSMQTLERAMHRVKFDELLIFQLHVQQAKKQITHSKAVPIPRNNASVKKHIASLPFKLTTDQQLAITDVLADLERAVPMNRLIEGEVGSGKTLVATIAMLVAAKAGVQAVLLAPTEILAAQHYATMQTQLAQHSLRVGLLTRSHKSINGNTDLTRAVFSKKIVNGEVDILIGTHAVLQSDISFKNLALAVIDEQHRFGVSQRQALREQSGDSGTMPHLLSMTATPIPRTLALALYGDLDLSVIRQLPRERKPIITEVVAEADKEQAYDFIREEITNGRQAFVVCPLIDPSDTTGAQSVKEMYEKLETEIFPEFSIGMLHGKLSSKAKEQVMQDFLENRISILVSTSVVEVGVNVPNASVILIEGAERFGLAQLHQFRGRVGRSIHQSYCMLFANSAQPHTLERLQALVTSRDGIELAEKDLTLRGPGQMYGVQQSGWPEFKVAQITDVTIMEETKKAADALLESDPLLSSNPLLKQQVALREQRVHME